MPGIIIVLKYPKLLFLFDRDDENVSENSVLRNLIVNIYTEWQNNAKLNKAPPKFPPCLGEYDVKIIST
jgi:hypothetical protein